MQSQLLFFTCSANVARGIEEILVATIDETLQKLHNRLQDQDSCTYSSRFTYDQLLQTAVPVRFSAALAPFGRCLLASSS